MHHRAERSGKRRALLTSLSLRVRCCLRAYAPRLARLLRPMISRSNWSIHSRCVFAPIRGNMPFSNEKGEGLENKLAELFAAKLNKKLDYVIFPAGDGLCSHDSRRASLRCHHGLPAGRRPRPGYQSLLPDGLCPGVEDRRRSR